MRGGIRRRMKRPLKLVYCWQKSLGKIMIEFKKFLSQRIADIEGEIGETPDDSWDRGRVSRLRCDLDFYVTAVGAVDDFESERSHARLQASRDFSARLNRAGMG